jgi:hypothetical protein
MTVDVQHLEPVQGPSRIGQATVVEQSRAVAEVMAAVQVAQACPRNVKAALDEMRRSCQQPRLAERAFYRYNRGDGMVTGPSIHLARELARCWGNFQNGIAELRRDDGAGQSEMQAMAWDVQTNTRNATAFIVPHARDTKKGRRDLTDLRDIYENNANNGARRLREMILGLLPQWYVQEAIDLCTATLQRGNGKPLDERVKDCVRLFDEMRISRERLESRIGHPTGQWTPQDLATLSVIWQSIKRGEITVEDEFPAATITAEDIIGPAPAAQPVPAPQPAAPPAPAPADEALPMKGWAAINRRFNELHLTGPGQTEKRRAVMAAIVEHEVKGPESLTTAEGHLILDNLAGEAGARVVAAALGLDRSAPAGSAGEVARAALEEHFFQGQGQDDGGALEDAAAADEAATGQPWTPPAAEPQDGDEQLPDPTVGGDHWSPEWPADEAGQA